MPAVPATYWVRQTLSCSDSYGAPTEHVDTPSESSGSISVPRFELDVDVGGSIACRTVVISRQRAQTDLGTGKRRLTLRWLFILYSTV
jgi:hypothetical protein